MKHDNVTVIESTATDLIKNEWTGQVLGVEATTKTKKDYYFGHLTVICDGYASKFRKEFIRHSPSTTSKFYGLEMKDAILPKPYHGHVILGDGAPILLYQIGTHETRALIDVSEGCPTAAPLAGGIKNHMRTVVVPALPECVRPAFIEAIEASHIRSMPNSWLPPTVNKTPGMIILGDALNMRHPLTGGGMTVGLNDVVLLSELLGPTNLPQLSDTKSVLKQMKSFHWRRKDVTSVINILAQALYALFAASGNPSPLSFNRITTTNSLFTGSNLKALQMGCFRYFQFGGNCIDGPVGLLAGIIRNPFVLVYHFFSVAFVAIWVKARMYPLIVQPFFYLFGGVSIFATAVKVIGPYILAELRT
jgi:squalene monooxygenase